MRVLPASGQSSSLLILPEACDRAVFKPQTTCTDERGGLYLRNESKTWDEYGQYRLDTYLEGRVGVEGDGLYGFDDLSLGWTGDGLPTLKNQSIAGVISPSFAVGSLALNARPVNFTNYNNPIPSLLQNLRNGSTPIPSLSWSYTAGAYNLAPKVFGSLVLGGYDSTRFESNNLTFPFGADISLDLQVMIQSIVASPLTRPFLTLPIASYISTLVPDIWLPEDVCDLFQRAYGLSYNSSSGDYYMNSTMHQLNLDAQPIARFTIGPEATGQSVQIQLPYWNFYLASKDVDPRVSAKDGSFRFPIRRASNDSQYILGRAFLQSAYLSTDYDRRTFNLSQAVYPPSSTKENIVAILPPRNTTESGATNSPSKGLSKGAIAGIAVGAAIVILSIAALAFICLRRRRRRKKEADVHELDDTIPLDRATHEVTGDEQRYELRHGTGLKHELVGDGDPKAELAAPTGQKKLVEADDTPMQIYELPAHEKKKVAEMEGEGHAKEMG